MTARDRTVLLVVAAMAMLAGFWFVALAPKRDDASKLTGDLTAAHERLDQARAAAANAEASRRRYNADYATVARLGKAVPVEDDVPSLVYQLQTSAHDNGIDFRSIKLAAAPAGATATPAANTAAAVASANGTQPPANGASGSTATSSAAAATSAVAAVLPPGASVGTAGFPTMPFSFSFDGGFFDMQRFMRSINGFTSAKGKQITVRGRLLTIDGFSLTASRKGFPRVRASIRATAYLLPSDSGVTAGATPTTPGGAGQTASKSTAPTTSAAATSIAGGNR